ncbi:unnamed protein product [Heterobilharzia americana]|nr:unnamed protein product [Heterobilharzia americana]
MPQNHCHILTAATGVSQLSESSLVGVTGDEPDGLSNTSDDVCMDNSSQDSFSGTMLPVHSSTNQLAACNASLGSEYNGNAVDALDNKSQYSNCRLRSALLTPYSPGSEIHSNDTRQSSQFPHRESSGIILPATQRSMTGSLPSEAFSNRTSPQKILEVICGTRETLNDLDQHEPKLGTSDSPQNISSVHHQTSWSAPPSVSSSSCATPDKEFFDVPNQSEIPQPLYPVRPSRFSFSSLPVKKRKLDWKLEADSFPSNRQSSDKHLHQLRKTSINSPSDFIITTSTLLPTLDHDISTHSSTDCSSSCIPERRQSVGDSPISEITQQQLDTPKPTPPLLRTCSIPVNTEQRIMNTSSKTPDPLVFHNHHPIEAKKSPRTHHQNHFSVLARTLTGSDNNDNVSHNNSFHLKQYLSESVLVRNSLDCSQILKHNVYGDNKTQPSSLANTFDLYTTTNYYDNIYRKAEDLYTSKDNYLTPTTPTRMSVTPDLLFRSPRNTLKHRFNVCNGSNNNSNNQSSSSASVSPINVSAITNMNKVTSLYHKTDSNCKQDFAKTLPSVNSDPYVLDHQNHHASNGSPTERKHGGLIQNRCYNEHSSQLSYTPTPKEDTSYVMNSFSRKRPSYMMDATLLKSNTTNRLSQVQDKNRHYQQPSSIINQKITVPDAATTTSTVVNQHFNNALVQTEVKNERKRILANSSPITIDSALFNKLSVDQSKASYLEPSNNTLPISLSPSSIYQIKLTSVVHMLS